MKKRLLFLIMMMLPLAAMADVVEIDGVYYNLIKKAKQAEVTKNPNLYSGEVTILDKIIYEDIEYNVTSIGNNAFEYCIDLTSIIIPNSVTSIGGRAFFNCFALSSVSMSNSVTSIGDAAFYQCTSLTSIDIPNSVTHIGASAFGTTHLTSITIPNGVTCIENGTFSNCGNLTSITIPYGVVSIEGSAFGSCINMESIEISNSVTNIGSSAFANCKKLNSVTIPNSVTYIHNGAFNGCSKLISITIGSSVESIGSYAFANCPELTDVYCLATNIPFVNNDAFYGSYIEYVTLHVPASLVDAYKAADPWENFKSIVAIDGETPLSPKCATPVIEFKDGELNFTCETEGVEFVSEVTCADVKKYYDSSVKITPTFTISVFATKAGYDNSDTATKEIKLKGDINADGSVDAQDASLILQYVAKKITWDE